MTETLQPPTATPETTTPAPAAPVAKPVKTQTKKQAKAKAAKGENKGKKGKAKRPATSLDARAMLVNLLIGFWSGRKVDNEKTDEITKDEKAANDAGIWWTRIVPASASKAVVNARLQARVIHLKYTMPWADDGFRVLPADMFMDYMTEIAKAERNFRAVVDTFLEEYPGHVKAAEERLGGLYKADAFPKVEELKGRFPWSLRVIPLPTAGDFRVDLGDAATAKIREEIEAGTKAAMNAAMNDLWTRLHGTVSHIAERLGDPEAVFRDTLLKNANELCTLLGKMNVTKDAKLDEMRKAVEAKLTGKDIGTLRSNKAVRADVAKAANDILKNIADYMSAKK